MYNYICKQVEYKKICQQIIMDCCNCQCTSRKQENVKKYLHITNKILLASLTYLYEHVKNN